MRCDDSESDSRVDVEVCRRLGTRSIVAVPIASAHGTIGLLEAFSAEAHGFNDSDVRSLNLLAELILAAIKPEEENRLAEISQRLVAGEKLDAAAGTPAETPVAALNDGVAEPGASPELFQEYGKKQESTSRLALILLLAALVLALGAGLYWKFRRAAPAKPAAPVSSEVDKPMDQPPPLATTESLPTSAQSAASPSAAAQPSSGEPPSATDDKNPSRTLITGIWHLSSPDSSTVIIDMQGEVQYEAHRLGSPERIYFDLHDTTLAPGMFGKTIEIGDTRLARVRIAQPSKGVSRVVLETTGDSDFSVSMQSNPYRLVVVIRKTAKSEHVAGLPSPELKPEVAPVPAAPPPAATQRNADRQVRAQLPKFRLVLDAGHGGWDLGTVGRKGLMEKDLVLDIVRRLGTLVQKRLSAEVIYTRQDDNYLPLEKRTEIANLAQADLFVSVHANYSQDSSARGSETYYTNTYSSVRARTADAGAENAAAENVNWTNVDIREKVQKSRRFAVAVQQSLYRTLATQIPDIRNRGVKEAAYVVLTGTSMPAILAEVSFVSSPADEARLQSTSYRQKIAEGLFKGIAQYAGTLHRVNVASAATKPSGF